MTIHHSAILRPYSDEMLRCIVCGQDHLGINPACPIDPDDAIAEQEIEIEMSIMCGAKQDAPSEDALDHARDDRCIDCMQDPCTCAPDTHRETIGFAFCAR